MAQPSRFVLTRDKDKAAIDLVPSNLDSYIRRHVSLGLAPITGINVGAVGMISAYLGINIELPGLPLNQSIHAVQFLITNLALHSERDLHFLAVSSDNLVCNEPCGHCLQFLEEIREPDTKTLIENKSENKYVSLENLLPRPDNLNPEDYSRLPQWRNNRLTLNFDPRIKEICADSDKDDHRCTNLKCMALAAANRSYAPYTKCPSGLAMMDGYGKVYRGWYMESVASNPSLGPLQAALVDFVFSGGNDFKEIVDVVLVEKKDAKVTQEDVVKMILQKITNGYDFNVFHCSDSVKP